MRLIAKNSDYYDHYARNRGLSDQLYVWNRTAEVKKVDFALPAIVRTYSAWNSLDTYEAIGFCVWFCGQVIPVVSVHRYFFKHPCRDGVRFYYSFDSIPKDILGEKPKKGRRAYGNSSWDRFHSLFALADKNGWGHTWDMEQYPSQVILPKKSVAEMHRLVGSPIFCHSGIINETGDYIGSRSTVYNGKRYCNSGSPSVLVNPILDKISFQDRIDSFEAFQCLERYLANEMAPSDGRMDKPIPDKIKAESKGFDKFSFRKEPTKGKKS